MKVVYMLQLFAMLLLFLTVVAAVFRAASKIKISGNSFGILLADFSWWITNSPAQVAFFMFSFTAAIAASIISGAFAQIATQWVLSLDILFFLSIMLLVTFHRLKLYSSASF